MIRTTINGTATALLYSGQDLAAEYNADGTMARRYVFGPGIDEPLVQYEGPGTASKTWLYGNQQGSIVVLANRSGATTSSQAYGLFGETEGAPASRFGYTGQQYLAPLGLYYYKTRMYSPVLGRFLQTDPIGYKDDLNWYAYVGNNPINATDPSGLAAMCSQNNLMGVESRIQPIPTPAAIANSWSRQQSANLSDALSQGVVGPGIGAIKGISALKGIGAAAKGAEAVPDTIFKTTHYSSRLESACVNVAAAESAVAREVNAMRSNLATNADTVGRLKIDGVLVEYRVRLLENGTLNVGTLFPVK